MICSIKRRNDDDENKVEESFRMREKILNIYLVLMYV